MCERNVENRAKTSSFVQKSEKTENFLAPTGARFFIIYLGRGKDNGGPSVRVLYSTVVPIGNLL